MAPEVREEKDVEEVGTRGGRRPPFTQGGSPQASARTNGSIFSSPPITALFRDPVRLAEATGGACVDTPSHALYL
jgi:hypothetical protein